MNKTLLIKSAENLEKILLQYSSVDAEVAALLGALSQLIFDARTGKISIPVEWNEVPGGYYFTEGRLQKYSDLETAYANFKIEITGGESPVLRKLRLNAATKPHP